MKKLLLICIPLLFCACGKSQAIEMLDLVLKETQRQGMTDVKQYPRSPYIFLSDSTFKQCPFEPVITETTRGGKTTTYACRIGGGDRTGLGDGNLYIEISNDTQLKLDYFGIFEKEMSSNPSIYIVRFFIENSGQLMSYTSATVNIQNKSVQLSKY